MLAALRKNPTWLKQFWPILEDTLEEKLEGLGIKRVSSWATVESFDCVPKDRVLLCSSAWP